MKKSKETDSAYRLYRVYNFNMLNETGDYLVRVGSLEDMCSYAQTYRVDFQRNER